MQLYFTALVCGQILMVIKHSLSSALVEEMARDVASNLRNAFGGLELQRGRVSGGTNR